MTLRRMTGAVDRRLAAGDRLVVASHNPGKVREIDALLRPYKVASVSAASLDLPEPEETETTFEGNAELKAVAAAKASGLPALADDSGFCVAALGGDPGVYSARWAGADKDFDEAMARVHALMKPGDDPAAWFVCVLSLAWPDGAAIAFRGEVHGSVVWPPRGDQGFGYDPMFVPFGCSLTFGEMAPDAKHAMSHRAHAFRQFIDACF